MSSTISLISILTFNLIGLVFYLSISDKNTYNVRCWADNGSWTQVYSVISFENNELTLPDNRRIRLRHAKCIRNI